MVGRGNMVDSYYDAFRRTRGERPDEKPERLLQIIKKAIIVDEIKEPVSPRNE